MLLIFLKKEVWGILPFLKKNSFDGLELQTYNWKVSPLEVENVHSSFFEDKAIFPEGSIKFDNALLMKNIEHKWIGRKVMQGE